MNGEVHGCATEAGGRSTILISVSKNTMEIRIGGLYSFGVIMRRSV